MSHPSVTYGNGANVNVTTPFLNGYNVTLAGTSQANEPIVRFVDTNVANTLSSVSEYGHSAHALAYDEITMNPFDQPGLTVTNGIVLSFGKLAMGSSDGGATTIGGTSVITNDSTFTASGGRYQADATVLKGAMIVAGGSTADFSRAPLQGNGTIYVEGSSTVDVNKVVAGLHVDVLSGKLVDTNGFGASGGMSFLGTIDETAGGTTDVLNATTAVEETFNRSTGVLDLLNKSGVDVAQLKFAGASTLYTTPDAAGGMDITTAHHAGSLPTIFVH